MYRITIGLFLLFTLETLALASNRDPIILVHGFLGWGREEISEKKYWGGENDIQAYLRSKAILSIQSLLVQFPLTMTVLSKHFTKSKAAN